jgi:hypothetical protein
VATVASTTTCNGEQLDFEIVREFPAPALELAWRECLDRVDAPAHYNAPEYFHEPNQAAGVRRFAVLATQESRVVGVLTGEHDGDHAVCGQISRPQICLDETADRMVAVDALAQGLLTESRSAKLLTVYSWSPLEGFMRCGFRERKLQGVIVLDLSQGPEVLFKQLDKKRRNCIRYAMRQPLEIFEAMTERDVEDFYSVYSSWFGTARKKIEGQKFPLDFFQERFRHKENIRIFLARSRGKTVAGITLRFFPGGLVEYSNNSSLDDSLHLRPNDLLLWRAIEWACGAGFARFSLGGAHRFLREFGGKLTPIYRYRLDRTPLRRHDLRENLADWGRKKLHRMPHPVEKAIRKLTGKTQRSERAQGHGENDRAK